jgi:hypothetical protein
VVLHPVTFPYFDERSPPRLDDLEEGEEFRTLSYSGSGRVEGRVTRFGLRCDRSDFRALEDGEIALVARGECFLRDKARNAEAAGAAALLIVDGESDEPPSATLGAPGIEIPVLAVGAAAGQDLSRFTGLFANLMGVVQIALLGGRLVGFYAAAPDPTASYDELRVVDENTLAGTAEAGFGLAGEPIRFTWAADGSVESVRYGGGTRWPVDAFLARRADQISNGTAGTGTS